MITYKEKLMFVIVYDENKNPMGNFDGEFVYSLKDGSFMPYRVDGDEVYTMVHGKMAKYIGTFEDGKAIRLDGTIIFQCE